MVRVQFKAAQIKKQDKNSADEEEKMASADEEWFKKVG